MAPLKRLLFLLLALPVASIAQHAPGYLGKRFTVEYNAFLFPSFFNPNSPEIKEQHSFISDVKPSINLQNYLVGQYCASKKISLIASFGFNTTNFLAPSGYGEIAYPYEADKGYSDFLINEYPTMKVRSYSAGIRIYTQHFAPLGQYVEFRLGLAQIKTEDFSYLNIKSGSLDSGNTYTIGGSSSWGPSTALAWGTSRVIKDVVMISYGFDVSLYPFGIRNNRSLLTQDTKASIYYDQGNTADNRKNLNDLAAGRYTMQCFLNLRLGIGFVL